MAEPPIMWSAPLISHMSVMPPTSGGSVICTPEFLTLSIGLSFMTLSKCEPASLLREYMLTLVGFFQNRSYSANFREGDVLRHGGREPGRPSPTTRYFPSAVFRQPAST